MTKEQLYGAMSLIDDKYIAESMTEYKPKMPIWIKRSIATAAVLVICFSAVLYGFNQIFVPKADGNSGNMDPEAQPPSNSETEPTMKPGGTLTAGETVTLAGGLEVTVISVDYGGAISLHIKDSSSDEGASSGDSGVSGATRSIGVLVSFDIDGIPCFAGHSLEDSGADLAGLMRDYTDRSDLLAVLTDGELYPDDLCIDLSEINAVADVIYNVIIYIDGNSYLIKP